MLTSHHRGVLLCLLSAAGFGAVTVLAREAYDAGVNITTLLAARFTIAAAIFLIAARLLGTRFPPIAVCTRAFALGAIGYAGEAALYFGALSRLDATIAVMIFYLYPFLVFGGAIAVGRDRATPLTLGALTLAGGGVLVVLIGGNAALDRLDALGMILALSCALVYATYVLLADRIVAHHNPLAISAITMSGAAFSSTFVGLGSGHLALDFPAAGWIWVATIAIGSTVIGVGAFFVGVRIVGPSTASILSAAEPVVAVALAMIVLGEMLTPLQTLGIIGVVGAVILLQRRPDTFPADVTEPADRSPAGTLASDSA